MTIRCAAKGCRSFNDLGPTPPEGGALQRCLNQQGWQTVRQGDEEKYYCPAHKDPAVRATSPKPALTDSGEALK